MPISTPFSRRFGLRYPIALAPMGSVAGGRLAAAVSNAGALGMVGGGYGDPGWLRTELSEVRAASERPWGVGFITWNATEGAVELALGYEPDVFMLSFGDPRPFVPAVKDAGCTLICQVQSVADARDAVAAGADVVVAQGTEAGGHGASRATLPLVPAIVDAISPTPVLAAGGIADGRGLAAALMLGAEGVLVGTRFYAAAESLGHPRAKERLAHAAGDETQRTRIFDVVRGHSWPEPYTGRALRNPFMQRWHGREEDLAAALDAEGDAFSKATQEGDFDTAMVWAGEAVDLVSGSPPAAELVDLIGAEAEACLLGARGLLERGG